MPRRSVHDIEAGFDGRRRRRSALSWRWQA
jgi:hypothetical protein